MFNNLASNANEMASFHLRKITLGMLRIGYLEEGSSEELTKFMQLMVSWGS
jgi:hypothetical protein